MSCVQSSTLLASPLTSVSSHHGQFVSSKSEKRLARIQGLMVQKVSRLYKEQTGRKITSSKLVYMQEEVDRILASRNPTDNDLQKLVQKLKHQSDSRSERRSDVSLGSIEGGREGTTCVKAPPISSSVGMAASDSSERRSEITPSRPALPPPSLPPGHQTRIRHVKNDMWAKLSRKDLQDYEKEEQQRRQKAKDRMMQQKHSLDAQIMQQTERKKRDQHDADVVLSTESKKLEQWRAQKDADDRQKRMSYENEKKERDEQLRDLDIRRKRDEEDKKHEEELISAKIQRELEAEQRATMKKKQTAKDNVTKYMEYNAEQRALKDSQKQKEFELDKELHKMYIDKLERQEREREVGLKKLYDRQSKQVAMGSRMAAGLAERAQEDERRAAAEQERMLEKVQRQERHRLQAITNEKEKIKSYLAKQIEEKEKRKIAEKTELLELRETLMADVRAAEQQEKDKARAKRQRDVANRSAIEHQILSKKLCSEAMTKQERLINRQLLRRLTDFSDDDDAIRKLSKEEEIE